MGERKEGPFRYGDHIQRPEVKKAGASGEIEIISMYGM